MKHLTRMTTIVAVLAALATVPVCAQPRGSRGGSHGGGSSHSSGSYSRPSAQRSMSSPSPSSSKGLSTAQPHRSAPSQSYSSSRSQSSRPQSYSSHGSQPSRSYQSAQPSPRSSQPSVRGSQPSARSSQPSVRGSQPSVRNGQPSVRSTQPSTRSVQPSRGSVQSSTPRYANGNINRNQPAPGMSVDRNAPRSVREPNRAPSNWSGGNQPREVRMRPDHGRDVVRVVPRERPPMPFNRPARFWDGGHHYYGYRVGYLPDRYIMHTYWGVPYYYLDGIYYRRYGLNYYVCRPPFGVFFDPIVDLAAAACNFAYFFSVANTYNTIDENAATITAQNQTIAANNAVIAQQNETIALNTQRASASYSLANSLGLVQSYADASTQYFYDDGVFFTKDADGKYVTIVPPAGAIVQELPDDYDQVTINGNTYYKVDNTIFSLTIIDGSPYFEVLGQMTGDLAARYDLNK